MNGYRYNADQGTHAGIPARDLTQAEVDAMTPLDQRTVRLSPAYTAKGGNPPKDPEPPKGSDGKGGKD